VKLIFLATTNKKRNASIDTLDCNMHSKAHYRINTNVLTMLFETLTNSHKVRFLCIEAHVKPFHLIFTMFIIFRRPLSACRRTSKLQRRYQLYDIDNHNRNHRVYI